MAAPVPAVLRQAFTHVLWPPGSIQINPRPISLVGLAPHFWVTGYGGGAFGARDAVVVEPPVGREVPLTQVPADDPRRRPRELAVTVFVWPVRYAWDFGDGTPSARRSLGRPYAGEGQPGSDVQHRYEFTSLRHPTGFPVTLEATFAVAYTVDFDGRLERVDLPATTLRYQRRYPVQEVQGVLLAPDWPPRR